MFIAREERVASMRQLFLVYSLLVFQHQAVLPADLGLCWCFSAAAPTSLAIMKSTIGSRLVVVGILAMGRICARGDTNHVRSAY